MNRDAALAVTGGKALPPHRKTALRDILDPRTGEVLDQVIHPDGNPGANRWFLKSTLIQISPESGVICGGWT